jgi:hypothetical protein
MYARMNEAEERDSRQHQMMLLAAQEAGAAFGGVPTPFGLNMPAMLDEQMNQDVINLFGPQPGLLDPPLLFGSARPQSPFEQQRSFRSDDRRGTPQRDQRRPEQRRRFDAPRRLHSPPQPRRNESVILMLSTICSMK